MKNIIKLFAIGTMIGITLPIHAHAQQIEFSYTSIAYTDLVYDDPDTTNLFSDKLYGSLWQYEQTINPNNKWAFSYQELSSPTRRYVTGNNWQANNQPEIYESTRKIDSGALAFAHYRPLNDIDTVKLYIAPTIFHTDSEITLEYINNPFLETYRWKSNSTDIDLDIGFAFYPIKTLEIITSSNYTSAIADSDIENDDDLESGYEGYHINIEYKVKSNTKIFVSAYHDDHDLGDSYTSIGYNGTITPKFGINFEYVLFGDDVTIVVFGPTVVF